MKTRETIEEVFKNTSPWYAYKEGYHDGNINGAASYWNDIRNKAAIAAMQSLLSNPETLDRMNSYHQDTNPKVAVARIAVDIADELIKQLNKK